MEMSWEEDGETFSVQGASTPGAPFMMVGKSKTIVWSMTAPVNDNSDLWQEELSADETKYKVDSQWRDLLINQTEIKIKGQESLMWDVKKTHRGPIFSSD
jgi:penicillin G amidase